MTRPNSRNALARMPRQPLLEGGCICPTPEDRAAHAEMARLCSTVPHLVNCAKPLPDELEGAH